MFFPIFLSVVLVVRNHADNIEKILTDITDGLSTPLISEYELIVVDNASDDGSVAVLKNLTDMSGLPNMIVYALTKEVDIDIGSWVGLENALGDFIVVLDPLTDDIGFLPAMLDKAASGVDVVFATNAQKSAQSLAHHACSAVFNYLYKSLNGVHLSNESPQYRLLSKKITNYILQHSQPALAYRHLPATSGFSRANLNYSAKPRASRTIPVWRSIERDVRLLVSTTRAPMRLVSILSLFGASANLVYSVYVVAIGLLKTNVSPGWVSLSLQQSGMFFLISLVLLVLGEYIVNTVSLSNGGPAYHVGQELTSTRMTRLEKLNIEEAASKIADPTQRPL